MTDPTITASTPRPAWQPDEEPQEIERRPWSQVGPAFIEVWGRFDPKDPQPENLEAIGQNGSGKSFAIGQILAEMVRRRSSHFVFIATKPTDKTISSMGLPIVDTVREFRQHDQCVFWPRTKKTGVARKEYQASRIRELLDAIWADEEGNIIVVFDEFSRIETMSPDLREILAMFLREGRSHGITCVAGKQRAQGVNRDMHSESRITLIFPVKHEQDKEACAEVLGSKKLYLPVIKSLSLADHEFILRHEQADLVIITYIDQPVDVAAIMKRAQQYRR
jgi:nucleoside-triphosphatase THEP1